MGPGAVHKSEKSAPLKNSNLIQLHSHYSNRAVISIVQLTENPDKVGPDNCKQVNSFIKITVMHTVVQKCTSMVNRENE